LSEVGTDIVGNNVLAKVADLNSFVKGISIILKLGGVCTIEFPHLLKTIEGNQFDQIYHEHFSYFSALTVDRIFAVPSHDDIRNLGSNAQNGPAATDLDVVGVGTHAKQPK
jgi:hypothetical protein